MTVKRNIKSNAIFQRKKAAKKKNSQLSGEYLHSHSYVLKQGFRKATKEKKSGNEEAVSICKNSIIFRSTVKKAANEEFNVKLTYHPV